MPIKLSLTIFCIPLMVLNTFSIENSYKPMSYKLYKNLVFKINKLNLESQKLALKIQDTQKCQQTIETTSKFKQDFFKTKKLMQDREQMLAKSLERSTKVKNNLKQAKMNKSTQKALKDCEEKNAKYTKKLEEIENEIKKLFQSFPDENQFKKNFQYISQKIKERKAYEEKKSIENTAPKVIKERSDEKKVAKKVTIKENKMSFFETFLSRLKFFFAKIVALFK